MPNPVVTFHLLSLRKDPVGHRNNIAPYVTEDKGESVSGTLYVPPISMLIYFITYDGAILSKNFTALIKSRTREV
jgi:hypothetical protein